MTMPMLNIVITEFMDESAVDSLRTAFAVRYDARLGEPQRRGELLEALETVDALIVRNRTQVDAGLLERAPRLRVVGRLGVGLDNIDVAPARRGGSW
jgi:(S)-sulfolactate dehydrogenase